jgi:DNA-binding NarL/FixJ family response regulator
MKILLVDDHKLIRDALKSYMDDDDEFEVVDEAGNGQEALILLKTIKVDVVMLDISMPVMDGIVCAQEIRNLYPDIKVLALSMMNDNQFIKQMLAAGALGYILKNSGEEEIKKALRKVNDGESYYSAEVAETVMQNMMKGGIKRSNKLVVDLPLTSREEEVLHLIIKEYTNQEIADELFISTRTVDAHKRNLLEKTGSKNVAGLVLYAIEKNLFEDL